MMKADIHPKYHTVTVEMTDGTKYQTRTTHGKEGDTIKLLVDSKSHPAYTGQRRSLDTEGRMERFNRRFGR
jgi:large subunit ribosomal protein L31